MILRDCQYQRSKTNQHEIWTWEILLGQSYFCNYIRIAWQEHKAISEYVLYLAANEHVFIQSVKEVILKEVTFFTWK